MGFTHYFETKATIPQSEWTKEFVPAVKLLIEHADVPIVGPRGEPGTQPVFTDDHLRFNGLDEDSHETMEIVCDKKNFYFCKTARKPYDKVCVAVCVVAETLYPGCFSWSSDGEGEDYKSEGEQLIRQTFDITDITHGNLVEAIKEKWNAYQQAQPLG